MGSAKLSLLKARCFNTPSRQPQRQLQAFVMPENTYIEAKFKRERRNAIPCSTLRHASATFRATSRPIRPKQGMLFCQTSRATTSFHHALPIKQKPMFTDKNGRCMYKSRKRPNQISTGTSTASDSTRFETQRLKCVTSHNPRLPR